MHRFQLKAFNHPNPDRSESMDLQPYFVPGVIATMSIFAIVLAYAALVTRPTGKR